jgi:magnesium-transporting ATPase (P-type)
MTTTDPAGGWHARPVECVLAELAVARDGLSAEQARERLARHGPNRLRPPPRRSALARFLGQFNNVLIYVLLGAAAMTALLAHWPEFAVSGHIWAGPAVMGH